MEEVIQPNGGSDGEGTGRERFYAVYWCANLSELYYIHNVEVLKISFEFSMKIGLSRCD